MAFPIRMWRSRALTIMEKNLTLGLTATSRGPSSPPVTNDGAGTFFAQSGEFPDGATDDNRSLWNFSFFTEVYGGNGTQADYEFDLLYDFDPAGGTGESDHGVLDADAFVSIEPPAGDTQGSQNPGFDYLASDGFFTEGPAFTPFDPTVAGLYTFSLRAFNLKDVLLGESAILVNVRNVTTSVPEPSSLALLGLGLAGVGVAARSRRRKNA